MNPVRSLWQKNCKNFSVQKERGMIKIKAV